jgi:thymidine kinase
MISSPGDMIDLLSRHILERTESERIAFVYGPMGSGKSNTAICLVERLSKYGRIPVCIAAGSKPRNSITAFGGNRVDAYPAAHILKDQTSAYSCRGPLIIDEAQFLTPSEISILSRIIDSVGERAVCFGLYWRADGKPFEGTKSLLRAGAIALPIPHSLRCWCGAPAVADVLIPTETTQETRRYVNVCDKHKGS